MNIDISSTYDELSTKARDIITGVIIKKSNSLICASTGSSPTRTYELVTEACNFKPQLFNRVRIIKLDEWGNIPMDHPKTCESYLQKHLIKPLNIPSSRYISLQSNPENPTKECDRIQNELKHQGPIDLCLLGLGMNGHIALNEPAEYLQPHCHVATLSETSLKHPMAVGMKTKPTYGLTLGMTDILQSKKILMLINGANKYKITKQFLSKKITTKIPASFLWLHPDVTCFIDKEALEK